MNFDLIRWGGRNISIFHLKIHAKMPLASLQTACAYRVENRRGGGKLHLTAAVAGLQLQYETGARLGSENYARESFPFSRFSIGYPTTERPLYHLRKNGARWHSTASFGTSGTHARIWDSNWIPSFGSFAKTARKQFSWKSAKWNPKRIVFELSYRRGVFGLCQIWKMVRREPNSALPWKVLPTAD